MKLTRAKAFYETHEKWISIVSFLAGFFFDIFTLDRIDSPLALFQQAAYLAVSGALIYLEILRQYARFQPSPRLAKLWLYQEAAVHFILGSLLSVYTLLYFKSASAFTSLVFIFVLTTLMLANEFKRFGGSAVAVHVALHALCTASFFICAVPIALGFLGILPFLFSIALSLLVFGLVYKRLAKRIGQVDLRLKKHVIMPALSVHTLLIALYFLHLVPPVPLSIRYIGIYHEVKKDNGRYELSYSRPWYKFWQNGDQTFVARPGDKIHCFASIFSPTRFKDEVRVRWVYRDKRRGWLPADAIPLAISGGRDEGFRGVTTKANYMPGDWRVEVETVDGRELGRIYFTVSIDESVNVREYRVDVR